MRKSRDCAVDYQNSSTCSHAYACEEGQLGEFIEKSTSSSEDSIVIAPPLAIGPDLIDEPPLDEPIKRVHPPDHAVNADCSIDASRLISKSNLHFWLDAPLMDCVKVEASDDRGIKCCHKRVGYQATFHGAFPPFDQRQNIACPKSQAIRSQLLSHQNTRARLAAVCRSQPVPKEVSAFGMKSSVSGIKIFLSAFELQAYAVVGRYRNFFDTHSHTIRAIRESDVY
ncbi:MULTISPECIES: hypothetical protein [unclassified Caballeronia]|uniref:hypothetical protein n=1 Tax=unclassified Caballeronia TaxID=2646786 RepID=UPI00285DDB71|nr:MULTISPECIES: hypothetical protein [unclassified Caballeronia]MDR5771491.1 hypothetical protein [Caballeronia sp. LZ002]MDR5805252.1 hypothetical protein [Caballeronia sp. LZ001]MDR5846927.1 hypothetical protein [Caballeronia sp. LZ003]